MNDDKFLRDLMADYKPQMTPDDTFMKRFERQLELVEYVKACHKAERQKNRRAVSIIFAVGLVAGSLLSVLFVLMPNPMESLLIGIKSQVLIALLENVRYVGMLVCGLIICGVLLLLINAITHRPQEKNVEAKSAKYNA